uniref:electron transfer flavoprotein subunit beta/FixA family protein n=1 Tax=Paenibacillus vietnamensis TaxID=2590547 RepID=UPI0037C58B0C
MKIVVLLKQTFDTEEKIVLSPSGVNEQGAKFIINPYDEYALEEALRQREKHGGQVIAVACGPERSQEALRTALAIGADEAIRVDGSSLPDDGFTVAGALAKVVEPLQPDLLLAGLFAVDSGAGSVALQVAQRLGLPHASAAVKATVLTKAEAAALPAAGGSKGQGAGGESVSASGNGGVSVLPQAERYALVERDIEGDTETVLIPLPALITAQQGLNEPRYPSLPGIMKAKKKPLRTVDASELWGGAAAASVADAAPRTQRTQLFPPPPRAAGKLVPGEPSEQAAALVHLLRSEAKLL